MELAATESNYLALLQAFPGNHVIFLPDAPRFTIVAVTDEYLRNLLTKREDVLHHGIAEVFSNDADLSGAAGIKKLSDSLHRVIQTGAIDRMPQQSYNLTGLLPEPLLKKLWQAVNKPVFDTNDNIRFIIHTIEEVAGDEQIASRLAEEHKRLNEAQAIGRIGSFEWKLGDEGVSWSDEMYRINGMAPQSEVITIERSHTLTHPDDLAQVLEMKRVSFLTPGYYQLQHRIVLDDATVKWVAHGFESLADESGNVVRVHGTLQEITDLKKSEKEIRDAKELLSAVANAQTTALTVLKAIRDNRGAIVDFKVVFANQAAEQISGVKDYVGRRIYETFPEEIAASLPVYLLAMETGQTCDHEFRYDSGALQKWLRIVVVSLNDGVMVSREDITERKQREAELLQVKEELTQQAMDKYLTLFNSIDEGFLLGTAIQDSDGQIDFLYEDVNPAYERITGINKKDLVGRMARVALPGLKENWYEAVKKAGWEQQPVRIEEFAAPIDKWLDAYYSPFGIPGEHKVAVVFRDITQRKNLEEGQKFLLTLSDAITPSADRAAIHLAVTQTALDHFGADRCYYCEIQDEEVIIRRDAQRHDLPSIAGSYPLSSAIFRAAIEAGHSLAVPDILSSGIPDGELLQQYLRLQVVSFVNIPVIREGKAVGMLCICQGSPRRWSDSEIELAAEAAERSWAAIEKSKAEDALQQSKEKYRQQLEEEVAQRTKELKDSRELLQTAFDTTLTGLAVFETVRDADNTITDFEFRFLNKEAINYYGSDLRGKRYAELHPGIRHSEVFERYVTTVENNEPQDFEVHYQMEGYDNWFRIVTVKLGDGFLMSYEEITARKRAESERLKHLTLMHQSEALASIGSWEYDITTGKFTWSEGMYSLFELNPEKEVTPEIYLQLAVDEHKHIAAQVVKGIRGELMPLDETLHLRINGHERILKIKTTIIKDEKGRPVRSLGVDMDVTATQKAQAQLKEQAHFIQSTNQALPDILFVMNIETKKLVYINHSFESKLGYTDEQAKDMQQPFFDTMLEEDVPRVMQHIEGMRDALDGEVREIEYRRIDGQGNAHWFEDRNSVFKRDTNGNVLEKVGITQDITDNKKAEQGLKESNISLRYANENLQQFASIASHDLQEPLRKLKFFVSVLQRLEKELPPDAREILTRITVTSERMSQLIREVLQYSKIAYGTKEFVPVSLDVILLKVFGDLDLLLEETDAVITYPQPLPQIGAIPPQINQLFYNLLTNALKFRKVGIRPQVSITYRELTPEESKVHPELKEGRSHLEIVFSDNGIGFEQEYSQQIFQIFERLHPVDEFEGTGVGLALCKKIAENHGGHIYAMSTGEQGASFHILLPVNQ